MHAEMNYRINNVVETENYEIAAKGFENTRSWHAFSVVGTTSRTSSEILPVGYLKGLNKSESSLMTCEAELHGWASRMQSPVLSHMGISINKKSESSIMCHLYCTLSQE